VTPDTLRLENADDFGASPRKRLLGLALREAIPLSALVELTWRCNLRCIHCYGARQDGPAVEQEMSTARSVALMAELAAEGCLSVSLTGGEIGLRSDWADVAWAAKRARMTVDLLTNGTLFTAGDVDKIRRLRVRKVCVTLYGASGEVHDSVTRVEGLFRRTLATLRALRGAGVNCRVGTVLMKASDGEYQAVLSLARELGCAFLAGPNVFPRADGRTDVVEQRVPVERLRRFYSDAEVAPNCVEGLIASGRLDPARSPVRNCGAGVVGAFISANGHVLPCVGFEPSFGSVIFDDFRAIWRGPASEAHRSLMARPLAACSGCEISAFCTQRCARIAQVEDGSPLGPSSRACEVARLLYDMHAEVADTTAAEIDSREG
jgi:radical SAM protein with 4Fe4S-binding SPASM domain